MFIDSLGKKKNPVFYEQARTIDAFLCVKVVWGKLNLQHLPPWRPSRFVFGRSFYGMLLVCKKRRRKGLGLAQQSLLYGGTYLYNIDKRGTHFQGFVYVYKGIRHYN